MRVHISVWVEFASVYMFFTLLEPKALMINDAAYIAARGGPQVPHKDLKPRAVNAVKDTVVLSVFVVLTHCPHDGQHGGWVAGHTFLSFFPHSKGGASNSHDGIPVPWQQVPFPEHPGSVTILNSLTPRAVCIFPRPFARFILVEASRTVKGTPRWWPFLRTGSVIVND